MKSSALKHKLESEEKPSTDKDKPSHSSCLSSSSAVQQQSSHGLPSFPVKQSTSGYIAIDAADVLVQKIVRAGGSAALHLKDYCTLAGVYEPGAEPGRPGLHSEFESKNLKYGKVELEYSPAVKRSLSDTTASSSLDSVEGPLASSASHTPSSGVGSSVFNDAKKSLNKPAVQAEKPAEPQGNLSVAINLDMEKDLEDLRNSGIDEVPEHPDAHATAASPCGSPVTNVSFDTPLDYSNVKPNELMMFATADVKLIIKWAKVLPGFKDLPLSLQVNLLKESFLDLSILRLSYRTLKAADGYVHFTNKVKMKLETVYSHGWSLGLVNGTARFTSRLEELELDHTEFIILSVMSLIASESQCLDEYESKLLLKVQCRYLQVLRYYHLRYTPWRENRYCRLLLRLPTLQTIASEAKTSFMEFAKEGQVEVNSLIAELMRMPKLDASGKVVSPTL